MYFSAFDFLNNSGNNGQRPQDSQQNDQFPGFYQQQPSFSTDYTYVQPVNNRPVTPLDAAFPSTAQPYFGDDFFQPEVGADQFLLPSFTTIYQGAPTDNQPQSSRLYSDFMVDTPQPQYANLVVPGSAVKQPPPNKEMVQHQSFASGFLSPFPAATSDFYEPYLTNAPLITGPASPVNNTNMQMMTGANNNNTNNELSLFGSGFFDQNQHQQYVTPHQNRQPEQFLTVYRQDAAVDTYDLTGASSSSSQKMKQNRRKKLPVGALSAEIPLSVVQRPHRCTLCNSSFTRAWTLRQHMASHAGVKIFYCPLCGKSLARRQNVAYHLKKRHCLPLAAHFALSSGNIEDENALLQETMARLDDGSHQCLTCNQTFNVTTRLNLLVSHSRRHAANFCCMASTSCRKRFRSIDALIAHSNSDHFSKLNEQPDQQFLLDCSQCSASFKDLQNFQKHLIEHARANIRRINSSTANEPNQSLSKRRHKCLRCWRTFTTRLALSRHMQTDSHSYVCTVLDCGRVFTQRRRLDAHVKLAHSALSVTSALMNPQQLPETSSTVETAVANFTCSICNRCFETAPGLARHSSRTHGIKKSKPNEPLSNQPATKTRIPCPFRESETRPCGSMFDRQSQLDKHLKLYHRKRGHRHKKSPGTALNL